MSNSEVPSWVMLFDNSDYSGRHLTTLFDTDVSDFKDVTCDDSHKGFNDKVSAAIFCIASGWTCRLWENANYDGKYHDLTGTGELMKVDLSHEFNDKTSSLQWMSLPG
jgi:hypothetical protein